MEVKGKGKKYYLGMCVGREVLAYLSINGCNIFVTTAFC